MKIFNLKGRVALVTGSGRGLGRAMATGLARAGATVVLNGRSEESLSAVASALSAEGLSCSYNVFDITDKAEVISAVEQIQKEYGSLDILINNVGVRDRRELYEFDIDAFDKLLSANLLAPFELARIAAKEMARRQWGRIINITSVAGPIAGKGDLLYTASKGGLEAMSRSLAVELGKSGITVNAIAPGWFATEMNAEAAENPDIARWLSVRSALGRWGDPEEVVGPAVFLASDSASYVTGHVLVVDGGMLATM